MSEITPSTRAYKLDTMQWCRVCDEYILRSRDHPHDDLYAMLPTHYEQHYEDEDVPEYDDAALPPSSPTIETEVADELDDDEDEDDEEKPEIVGGVYNVRKDVVVTVSATVVAPDEREAKRRVGRGYDEAGTVVDAMEMHTDVDERRLVTADEDIALENDLI